LSGGPRIIECLLKRGTPRRRARRVALLAALLAALLLANGCDSSVEYYPEGSAYLSLASCQAEDGVAVEGMVHYDGEIPDLARLWVVFWPHLSDTGIPPCYVEVVPLLLPAQFRFNDVPRGETWAMLVLLSVEGSFPPVPR
jgi:hypothetical protein